MKACVTRVAVVTPLVAHLPPPPPPVNYRDDVRYSVGRAGAVWMQGLDDAGSPAKRLLLPAVVQVMKKLHLWPHCHT